MAVEFNFDFSKSLAVITYIASQGVPDLTTYRMLKIIFLADKSHLVEHGRTITGDKYSALPDGPVPSRIYDLFKKQVLKRPFSEEGRRILANLTVDKSSAHPIFIAKTSPDISELSRSDIAAIDSAIKKFGHLSYDEFKRLTHEMAAFDRAWKSRKSKDSAPMKFEDFFENDRAALEEAKAEMIENDQLRKVFAQPVKV
jgi:uncharacterized phage-associated protein